MRTVPRRPLLVPSAASAPRSVATSCKSSGQRWSLDFVGAMSNVQLEETGRNDGQDGPPVANRVTSQLRRSRKASTSSSARCEDAKVESESISRAVHDVARAGD